MARTFLDLPPEVQSSIISWVLYPHQIAKACLVSRQLYDVSMPFLYHTMYLNVDRWKEDHLQRFIIRGHKGHQFVRTLDVDSDDLKTEPDALKLAKDVLQVLPRYCLTSFRCPLETGVDNDLMILLASTQSRLDFLSLGPLLRTALNIPTCLRPWPPTVKTIVIPWKISITTDISFYQQLLQRSSRTLQALTVRSETFMDGDDNMIYDPGAKHHSELLVRQLFAGTIKRDIQPPLEICDLNLQNQDLRSAKTTWLRAVDFTKLRTLQLWNCNRADDLLVALMAINDTSPLKIHGLVLSFEYSKQAPRKGLEFVRSINGLKYLNMCYPPIKSGKELFSNGQCAHEGACQHPGFVEDVLQPHADSMKDLYFGVGANNIDLEPFFVPSLSDLYHMAQLCPNIRQLAIPMPRIHALDAFAGTWDREDYGLRLDLLAGLPNLKTLRILTWPIVSDAEYLAPARSRHKRLYRKKIYLKYLDVIATSIARRINALRRKLQLEFPGRSWHGLSVIIFGSAEHSDAITRPDGSQNYHEVGPISYKVWRKTTEFGTITKAKRIDSNLMECEEPIAYVVDEDTDQGLSLEAYSWGSCNPSWV